MEYLYICSIFGQIFIKDATAYYRRKISYLFPPRSQLLKWVGNKQKFAVDITRYFPVDINRYIEPFLGSGGILATVAPLKGIGSDIFQPLIEIWQKLASDPKGLIEWYAERRSLIDASMKKKFTARYCSLTMLIPMEPIFYT